MDNRNNAERRPSPDALLREAQQAEQGRLKIFFGAAPGVGKTYEMLTAARAKKAEGTDVVAGIVAGLLPALGSARLASSAPTSTSFPR